MYSITYINSTQISSKVVRGAIRAERSYRSFGMERSIAATINRELRASHWLPPFATDQRLIDNMARWLTLEAAAQAVSVQLQQLEEYLTDKAPEAQFQAHGLLFDRRRWQAGKEFLQLLEQPTSASASAATPQTLQHSSEKERSYRWHETPIRLQIAWLPLNLDAKERQVLIAASSHDDFPISNLVGESELGELPAVLAQLLSELKADLPLRKIRYQRQQSKAKSTNSSRSSARSTQPPVETKQQNSSSSKTTQISLF